MRRLAAGLALLLVLSAVPAAAQITQDDLADARDRIREISADLDVKAAEYEAATIQQDELSAELDRLVIELAVRERELAEARVQAREVVLEMYMTGTNGLGLSSIFEAESFNEIPTRTGYLESLAAADRSVINHLTAISEAFMREQTKMEQAVLTQQQLTDRLTDIARTIETELAAADAEYRTLRAEWQAQEEERIRQAEEARLAAEAAERRRLEEFFATSTTTTTRPPTTTTTTQPPSSTTSTSAAATTTTTDPVGGGETTTTTSTSPTTTTTTTVPPPPPPPSSDGRYCPIDGPNTFSDTWGAPRSGGRTHKGVDMFATRGTPLVAVEDGYISRKTIGALSGNSLWITSDTGHKYFYAHMDAYQPGVNLGDRVSGGQQVGTVGNTGNARFTSPHLHFEYHPDGGGAVNPYPLAVALCR